MRAVIFLCAVLSVSLVVAPPAEQVSAPRILADRELGETPLLVDLRELCDRIGGRPTGAPSCERAIEWGLTKFKEAGLDSARTESFTVPALWLPQTAEASCIAPVSFPIRIAAEPYTASTSRPLEARLVDVGEGRAEDFQKLGETTQGAIALVHSKEMKTLDDLDAEYLRNLPLIQAAQKAQVAAILVQSTRPRGLLYRHPANLVAKQVPFPIAITSREQAERLGRLARDGAVRVRLNVTNKTGGAYQSRNVLAEIRGREKPDEIILIGAHLDSWDLGTGANDNGVNAATVIELARAMKQLKLTPRRTIRFGLFTGEEQGMFGSAGYVKSHAAALDQHVAMINFDTGSGRTTGFYVNGRPELREAIAEAFRPVPDLGMKDNPLDAVDAVDSFDFLLSGVPNFVANQDPVPYLPDYHGESDVFDMVDQREAKRNAAIAAVLLWGLAENPARPAVRQTRAEIEKLLAATKLEDQMKSFEQWEDWENGKRGVNTTEP
jgi:carboxypeptidase Q